MNSTVRTAWALALPLVAFGAARADFVSDSFGPAGCWPQAAQTAPPSINSANVALIVLILLSHAKR